MVIRCLKINQLKQWWYTTYNFREKYGKKPIVKYVCDNCGAMTSTWAGRCAQCGEWNTIREELQLSAPGAAGIALQNGRELVTESVDISAAQKQKRLMTNITDVDLILGGGIVPGSINLIAGQPGIGKSTLLLQLAYAVAAHASVLYVSGEESAH